MLFPPIFPDIFFGDFGDLFLDDELRKHDDSAQGGTRNGPQCSRCHESSKI